MKKVLHFCLLLITFSSFAQLSKTHYIPPISCSNNQLSITEEQYLYISCPNTTPINFKIIQFGSTTITGTVSRNNPYIMNIGTGNQTQFVIDRNNANSVISNKGFVIEADDLVYTSVRVNGGQGNQAGQITSKGVEALGKSFRVGAFTNTAVNGFNNNHMTFATVLATENNTTVTFSDIKTGVIMVNSTTGDSDFSVTLNSGQSYCVAVEGPILANRNGLIGMKISADKDIVVNSGSTTGSNAVSNSDYGMDQLVSSENSGPEEYIFIKSTGQAQVEVPMIVADEDNTEIFLNDNTTTTPDYIIQFAGEYKALNGNLFNADGNLYVKTSKKVFAFQSVGDTNNLANQNMFFVPPLSCKTPHGIDNVPEINKIGDKVFTGRVTFTTKTGATINFVINSVNYSLSALTTAGYTVQGPKAVTGNPNYETYTVIGLTGNVSVFSSGELYLASLGTSGNATFGGYYSGFNSKPEIVFSPLNVNLSSCIPNIELKVSLLSAFDHYQWYYDGNPVGTDTNTYTPLASQPGNYYVVATNDSCGTPVTSDIIPVSYCESDYDNDGFNDNIDLDIDNDGITNCNESYGNLTFNFTEPQPTIVSINSGSYSNSYSKQVTLFPANGNTNSFYNGNGDSIITGVQLGKGNYTTIQYNFAQPISLKVEYVSTANPVNLIDSRSEFVIKVESDKTITVLNPTNQLLIDTNYDGIYESGVTTYSSFEIRFIVNSNTPLATGTGTFSFNTNLSTLISITHKNLSDTDNVNATFKLFATCVPKDKDNDGIPDQLDYDSDNDGITDKTEFLGNNSNTNSTVDANGNGIIDVFESIAISDSDNDGVYDFYDLDSDNDGIYDLVESGSNSIDANNNGIIDGNLFGTNGIANNLETSIDSGILTHSIANSDTDTLNNYIDSDIDGDGCSDVIEAGFSDGNNDNYLGNSAVIVNTNGVVTNATNGYTVPNSNYSTAGLITITTQPANKTECELKSTSFTIDTNTVTSYQWQFSTDNGATWTNVSNSTTYSGSTTNTLTISYIPASIDGYQYRVELQKNGNSCGLFSNAATFTLIPLPAITTPVTLVQCEDDATIDGISIVNLTEKEDFISNATGLSFSYYKTQQGAIDGTASLLISNPTTYNNSLGNTVWVRVDNNTCFNVGQLNIVVTSSQIPSSFHLDYNACDDAILGLSENNDGITEFDFSDATAQILAQITGSSSYTIKYYKNQSDALSEANPLSETVTPEPTNYNNIANYRNTSSPNTQQIWVRVDNTLSNECFALGPYITLHVNKIPAIKLTDEAYVCKNKPFEFISLTSAILDGSSTSDYTYKWFKNNVEIISETNATLNVNAEGEYKVIATSLFNCSQERIITVKSSDIAHFENITIKDLAETNSILVNVSGIGDYVYSLDTEDYFQESNQFENILSGLHDIYIKDLHDCGIVGPIQVNVLGLPNYFSPNGDGFNDTWNIKDFNSNLNPDLTIKIFDRFGRLIKHIHPNGIGWDGTFKGSPLPSDDYWYSIEFENGRIVKGHFALKR